MRGQDLTQETKQSRIAENKRAFDEIFGDPSSPPEPDQIDGVPSKRLPPVRLYQTFRSRSSVAATKNNFDEGKETRNPASPNIIDFLCDVERTVQNELTNDEQKKFEQTYIYESTEEGSFTQSERSAIEQRLGRRFRANKISPVSNYFTSIRRNTSNVHIRSSNPESKTGTLDNRTQAGA